MSAEGSCGRDVVTVYEGFLEKDNERRCEEMERLTTFMDWNSQHSKDASSQSDL